MFNFKQLPPPPVCVNNLYFSRCCQRFLKRFYMNCHASGMDACNDNSESGRSLIEMLGVLAVMGVLTIGGVAGYYFAMTRYRANEIIEGVKQRAVIVSSQEKQAPGTPQNLSEFDETILDYKTTAWAGGLNGEENLFTIDVDDVPRAVCQDILNRNWDWPAGIFIYDTEMTDCPEGNVPMAFVFSTELNAQIEAKEQNPCYGKGVCCRVVDEATRQIEIGEKLLNRTCQGSGGHVCCTGTALDCRYGADIAKYKPYQETEATCWDDELRQCDSGLSCVCKTCRNTKMVRDEATCKCSCPNGYQEQPCDTDYYSEDVLKDPLNNTLCYQCAECPKDMTLDVGKCGVMEEKEGPQNCPKYKVYTDVVDLNACQKCVNGKPQLKDPKKTLVNTEDNTCCEPSAGDNQKCRLDQIECGAGATKTNEGCYGFLNKGGGSILGSAQSDTRMTVYVEPGQTIKIRCCGQWNNDGGCNGNSMEGNIFYYWVKGKKEVEGGSLRGYTSFTDFVVPDGVSALVIKPNGDWSKHKDVMWAITVK